MNGFNLHDDAITGNEQKQEKVNMVSHARLMMHKYIQCQWQLSDKMKCILVDTKHAKLRSVGPLSHLRLLVVNFTCFILKSHKDFDSSGCECKFSQTRWDTLDWLTRHVQWCL